FNPTTERFVTKQFFQSGYPIEEEYRVFHIDTLTNTLYLRAGQSLWKYFIDDDNYQLLAKESQAVHFSVVPDQEDEMIIWGARWMRPGLEKHFISSANRFAQTNLLEISEQVNISLALSADSLLIGTRSGLKLLTTKNDTFNVTPLQQEGHNTFISDILPLKNQQVLVSFYNQGLATYQIDQNTYDRVSLSDAKGPVDQLYQDREGNVLINRPKKGIDILAKQSKIIKPVNPVNVPVYLIPRDSGDYKNRVLLGKNGNLYLSSAQNSNQWTNITEKYNLPTSRVPKLISVGEERISLIGRSYLHELDLISGESTNFSSKNLIIDGYVSGAKSKRFLITDQGLQLYQINARSKQINFHKGISLEEGKYFTGHIKVSENTILLGYQGTQVWIAEWNNMAKNYQVVERLELPAAIFSAYKSREGIIYTGTNSGLYKLQTNESTRVLDDLGGLPDVAIEAIIEDNDGILWLGTRNGLIAYQPISGKTIFFSEEDGLPSNRFARTPPSRGKMGDITMSTEGGAFSFFPKELIQAAKQNIATPYFAGISINSEPYNSIAFNQEDPSIKVSYKNNSLRFKTSLLGLTNSPLSSTKYQLIGYEDWQTTTTPGVPISYPNLPPGEYELQLTAVNQNGLPSRKRAIKVIVTPPFTQTWTFYLLVALGTTLLLAGTYIFLLRQERLKQLRRQEQQARIAAERDRIAGEVHDDLGGQLSSIMYLSEELLLTEAVPGTERELQRIHELSRGSLQNVRDIIFALDNRRSTLASLGDQFRGAGTEFFQDRKIHYDYQEQLQQPDFDLSSRQKRNLTLIVKEAWHNIAKHAEAKTVSVSLEQAGDGPLTVKITDDGKGFSSPKSANGTGGYGLDNMHEKATSIGGKLAIASTPGKGTKLTLEWPLPKEPLS
ncbi:MAG: ATP-binding protein, partial [Bacteroidota bacterium]